MSHRLALTLALVLTIAFAGFLIVERERLFDAPSRAGGLLPSSGPIVDAAGPDGIANPDGGSIGLAQPGEVAPDQFVDAPAADARASGSAAPREQRRHDHGDDHNAESAAGGDDD
jgi:hypothetical protein